MFGGLDDNVLKCREAHDFPQTNLNGPAVAADSVAASFDDVQLARGFGVAQIVDISI